jgi:hypothetical protein
VTARARGGAVTPKIRAHRRFRENSPEYRRRESLRMQARYEAFMALARRHPAEYAALYEAELQHLGIATTEMERPCPACPGVIRRKAPAGGWPRVCEDCGQAARARHRPLDTPEPAMDRPCPCGGTIQRRVPVGRWPRTCGECA